MSFSPRDFASDTGYERFVLESLGAHRTRPPGEPGGIWHLEGIPRGGGASIHVFAADDISGPRIEQFKSSLRLLGFGAAFKILDLLIEHVLRANGASSGRLRFTTKKAALRDRPKQLPKPFDQHHEYWDRLTVVYAAFEDARHAVTHRRGGASSAGDLEVHDDRGRKVDTVSAAEIEAFMAALHGAAELAVDRSAESRRCRILAWHLNALGQRHKLPPLDADNPAKGLRLVIADLRVRGDGSMRIDVRRLAETVTSQSPSAWDLELRGGGRVFVGRWEDVPDQTADHLDFDPSAPPPWLTERLGS